MAHGKAALRDFQPNSGGRHFFARSRCGRSGGRFWCRDGRAGSGRRGGRMSGDDSRRRGGGRSLRRGHPFFPTLQRHMQARCTEADIGNFARATPPGTPRGADAQAANVQQRLIVWERRWRRHHAQVIDPYLPARQPARAADAHGELRALKNLPFHPSPAPATLQPDIAEQKKENGRRKQADENQANPPAPALQPGLEGGRGDHEEISVFSACSVRWASSAKAWPGR